MNTPRAVTRQAVLIAHAEEMRTRTGISHEEWAERVDTAYCQRVAERHRRLSAPNLAVVTGAEDYRKLLRAWDQTIRRYVSGELRFPVELEEAWVAALEAPYRARCLRELAERVGAYHVPRYGPGEVNDLASLADAIREFSDVTRTAAVPGDDRLVREVDEAIAALQGLRIRAQGGGGAGRLRDVSETTRGVRAAT